ncbi:transposase domain-containing protein [Streptomyces pimonensis]|uniref:Transposase domain-containing protein n=1 Tax=Streptomyces pimonensis TaxID=2860288 RepID=A0ABV4IXV9_9ACTN
MFAPELVDAAVAQHGRGEQQRRLLPARPLTDTLPIQVRAGFGALTVADRVAAAARRR